MIFKKLLHCISSDPIVFYVDFPFPILLAALTLEHNFDP